MGGQGSTKKKKASFARRWRLPWYLLPCLLALAGYLRQRRAAAAAALPLAQRCAANKFSYKGLGGMLQTDTAIRKGDLCCYYGGKDYTDAEQDKHEGTAHKMANPNGGVRVAHLPPLDACGVAQLAMDRHRIKVPHPTKLSTVLRAVRDYEKAAVADNSVQSWLSVAGEPFAYYATRDLQPGDEITTAFGAGYWLMALRHAETRPVTRLLLCIASASYQHMMTERPAMSECAALREPSGATLEIVFSTQQQAVVLRSGAPLSEMQAGGFIVKFLRVGVKSERFWAPFASVDDAADVKLKKLVGYVVGNRETTETASEFDS